MKVTGILTAAAFVAAFGVSGCTQTVEPSAYQPGSSTLTAEQRARVRASARQSALDQNDRICELSGQMAETVMRARQNGLPLSGALSAAKSGLGRSLTLQAYDSPAFYSAAGKARAISEFRIQAEVTCQQALG